MAVWWSEHWQLKPGVLGLVPGFSLPSYSLFAVYLFGQRLMFILYAPHAGMEPSKTKQDGNEITIHSTSRAVLPTMPYVCYIVEGNGVGSAVHVHV